MYGERRYTLPMHRMLVAALLTLALVFAACSQDDDDGVISIDEDDLTPDAAVTVGDAQPTPTARPTAAPSGPVVEVQGIVAVIDRDEGLIIINPLDGSRVDQVRVEADTAITSAGGGTITITELRISDRIIAKGQLAGGVMVADEIAISQVVPGSQPGG